MALVKMTRDTPEVPCGKTEGMFPEEAVASLKENGWKVADKTSDKAVFLQRMSQNLKRRQNL